MGASPLPPQPGGLVNARKMQGQGQRRHAWRKPLAPWDSDSLHLGHFTAQIPFLCLVLRQRAPLCPLSCLLVATRYFMPPLSPRASIKGPRGSPISGRGSPMGPPLISWGGPRLSWPGMWCIGAPWWGGPR